MNFQYIFYVGGFMLTFTIVMFSYAIWEVIRWHKDLEEYKKEIGVRTRLPRRRH